jgi:hypothetical protein
VPGTDLACVIHVHSTYSDGTGTVPQIAAAAARAGVDAVLLTDHDSLEARRRGEERWYGRTLVCVGEEVSPVGGNHYLAFGVDEEVEHEGMDGRAIVAAVGDAGGFGFLAHPFSQGSQRFRRAGPGMPWSDLAAEGFTGIELWSFVTDTVEAAGSVRELVRFVAAPGRAIAGPPARNLRAWDKLLARRPVVAIGGVDAHQIGVRIGGRVPLRLMGYHRSFSHLRTHVLLDGEPTGDVAHDRDAIFGALRTGRCYLAVDSLAPARGFRFFARAGGATLPMGSEGDFATGARLTAQVPESARLVLLRDGAVVEEAGGAALVHDAEGPGVYRVEVALGRRPWIFSNPIYLR